MLGLSGDRRRGVSTSRKIADSTVMNVDTPSAPPTIDKFSSIATPTLVAKDVKGATEEKPGFCEIWKI